LRTVSPEEEDQLRQLRKLAADRTAELMIRFPAKWFASFPRHGERSEAIRGRCAAPLDGFAALAMTETEAFSRKPYGLRAG